MKTCAACEYHVHGSMVCLLTSLTSITLAWEEVSDHAAARVPILFRSYNHPKSRDINERNPGPPCTHPIWKVARATSAAPLYFELIQLEGISLIDGGFGANNPTLEAWQSIIQLHNRHLDAVKVIVSIGTGKGLEKRRTRMKMSFHQVMWSHYKTMKAMASDTEVVHGQMQSVMAEYGHYYRLNVEDGLGNNDVPLDACKGARGHKTLTLIRRKTEEHLNKEPAKGSIRRLAETLVAIRRARSNADRDRWERFCHGLKYTCPEQGCRDFAQEFEERQTLRNHLELKHPEKFDVDDLGGLEKWLDAGKSYSVEEAE